MSNKNATLAILVIASLLASPIVAADGMKRDTLSDIPANAQGTGVHDTLVSALSHAGLVGALQGAGPFTVFAPTDQAFTDAGFDLAEVETDEENATLGDILTYHVVLGAVASDDITDGMTVDAYNGDSLGFTLSSGTVMVNDATVTQSALLASNGIIHVIDKWLMPPGAGGRGVAAVVQAELLATLQGDGPFTVFAPTDEAFAAAGIDLAALDNDEGKATLTDILLYHVVAGAVPSSAVTDGMSATAVNGDDLSFSVGDGVKVNDANVVLADVPASNGVIHVIDKVLMPPADEPVIPEGCDFVVGIDETGYAFDTPELSIDVGQTVCWIWEDEAMGHNVAQIENEGDTMRMYGGAHSGTAVTTLDYRKTFDEDQTFLYICEPHAAMDMVGKITVGTGIEEVTEDSDDYSDSDNSVPGFTAGIAALAVVGALMIAGRRLR